MKECTSALKLYAVTDRAWLKGQQLRDVCREVLLGGATILQLREKQLDDAAFLAEGVELKQLCAEFGVPLVINDNVMLAKQLGVGVHVGQGDTSIQEVRSLLGADALVGVSCQTVAQAVEAERNGADYLGVGAVFSTSTKLDADAVDYRELTAICSAVSIPVVAIGGISRDNLFQLAGSGIAGIAVVSALFAAESPRLATEEMVRCTEAMLAVPICATPGAIIDLDGTLLDSLPFWERLGQEYLQDKGIQADEHIREVLDTMELGAAADYLRKTYQLSESADEIRSALLTRIADVYISRASFFPGAVEFLQKLHQKGVRMALFTATERSLAIRALERHGVLGLFDTIVSTLELPMGKSCPESYLHVLGKLGTPLKDTVVYEDASYALAGARQSGMKVFSHI